MDIQSQLNKQAIDQLPLSKSYANTFSGIRRGHHINVIIKMTLQNKTPLDKMSQSQIDILDNQIVSRLMYLDM